MFKAAKKRVYDTYQETADIYDSGVSERLGKSRWGIETLTRLLLRDMVFKPHPKVLDLACGTGLSTFQLIDWLDGVGEFHGLDFSSEMIRKAEENAAELGYSVDFLVGDAEKLDYPDDSFDAVISNMSFQMFPDKLKALKEAFRVLRPGGMIGLLYGAKDHLSELVALCKEYAVANKLDGFLDSISDTDWMHIDLETTQSLFWQAGFRRPLIYGYHRVMHVNPSLFWLSNPYPAMWRVHIPVDLRDKVDSEIIGLMEQMSGNRGYRLNWYTIQAYGVKPS